MCVFVFWQKRGSTSRLLQVVKVCVATNGAMRFSVRSFMLRTFLFSHRKIKILEGKSMDENLQQSEVSIIPTETTPAKGQFPKKKLKAIFPAAIIILCAVAAIIINANRPINRFV